MQWLLKRMPSFLSLFFEVYDQTDANFHWTKVTQAAVKLELQAHLLPHCRKMPSWYVERNAQPEHYSNVVAFYHQICIETVDSVANCIVEHFNQKDYTMYANYEQVRLKEPLGELISKYIDQLCEFYSEFD